MPGLYAAVVIACGPLACALAPVVVLPLDECEARIALQRAVLEAQPHPIAPDSIVTVCVPVRARGEMT